MRDNRYGVLFLQQSRVFPPGILIDGVIEATAPVILIDAAVGAGADDLMDAALEATAPGILIDGVIEDPRRGILIL